MSSGLGHYDSLGNPCLKLTLCGVAHPDAGLEFDCIIDTGFSGFVQLPLHQAIALKLTLEGTSTYTLADGKGSVCLTALARTTFHEKTLDGVVTLIDGAQEILVGMGFLRQLNLALVLTKDGVLVVDEDDVSKISSKDGDEPGSL